MWKKSENYFNTLNSMKIQLMEDSLALRQFWAECLRITNLSARTSGHVFRHLTLGTISSENIASQRLPQGVSFLALIFSGADDGSSPRELLFCFQGSGTLTASMRRLSRDLTPIFTTRLARIGAVSFLEGILPSPALTFGYSCEYKMSWNKSR